MNRLAGTTVAATETLNQYFWLFPVEAGVPADTGQGWGVGRSRGTGEWLVARFDVLNRRRESAVAGVRVRGVAELVRLWTTPGVTAEQCHRGTAALITRWERRHTDPSCPVRSVFDLPEWTGVQEVFARRDDDADPGHLFLRPHHKDGRFTFAGHTEPYPGAWPTDAVLTAERGDLSLVWPYLR